MTIIYWSLLVLFLVENAYALDNSTFMDSFDNGTFVGDENSTLIGELVALNRRDESQQNTTPRLNPFVKSFQKSFNQTSTLSPLSINFQITQTAPFNSTTVPLINKNSTLQSTTKSTTSTVPIRITSRSKINQLLEAIDTRLKNASMLLDSHVLVMRNTNGTVNVTRTWSFQSNNKLKNETTPFNRTLIARIPLNSRPFRPHRRLSSHMSRFVNLQPNGFYPNRRRCERLTEQQKYIRLQSVGGLNQQYMANTPFEAARNFPRLLPTLDDPPTSMFSDGTMFSDTLTDINRLVDPTICDDQCQEIRTKLEEVLLDDNGSRKGPLFDAASGGDEDSDGSDTDPISESLPPKSKNRRGCRLEKFIPVGNCSQRGEEEFWDYEKLCTACQGVYLLSKECFPTFLNSVVCDKHENSCIFDRYTGISQGKCRTKKLNFKVMRNKGSKDCEDWEFIYLEVPIACECYLSKTSWLDSVPHLP